MIDTNPYRSLPIHDDSGQRQHTPTSRRSLLRRLAAATGVACLVLISGPMLWLGLLMLFGSLTGDATRYFSDARQWQAEIVGRFPAALFLSGCGAVSVFIGIMAGNSKQQHVKQRHLSEVN